MRFAITDHAVQRFQERVEGAKRFDDSSVRMLIRKLVLDGFAEGAVRDHPRYRGRRIVPFASGPSVLYLSLGPNETRVPGDFAVVGVMFEKDLGGKIESGITLGDVYPALAKMPTNRVPRFIASRVRGGIEERFNLGGVRELRRAMRESSGALIVYELMEEDELKSLM